MGHNFDNLKAHILSLSQAKVWEMAVCEWYLESVEHLNGHDESGAPTGAETCPCSHYPIIELCWLRNNVTGSRTFVGNVCVRQFIMDSAGLIADGIKRIRDDTGAALNLDATLWARERGWLTEWELKFCLSNRLKRRLSGRQQVKREEINRQVLRRVEEAAKTAASQVPKGVQ